MRCGWSIRVLFDEGSGQHEAETTRRRRPRPDDDDLRTGRLAVKRATISFRRVVASRPPARPPASRPAVLSSFDVDEFIARHSAIHEQRPSSRTRVPDRADWTGREIRGAVVAGTKA